MKKKKDKEKNKPILQLVENKRKNNRGRVAQKEESQEQINAFQIYYDMGKERSLIKLVALTHRHNVTLAQWSKKWNWQERVKQKDIDVAKRVQEHLIVTGVQVKQHYQKKIHKLITKFFEYVDTCNKEAELDPDNKKPYILIRNASDLDALVKLEMLLLNEPTSRTSLITNNKELEEFLSSNTEAREAIRTVYNHMQKSKLKAVGEEGKGE